MEVGQGSPEYSSKDYSLKHGRLVGHFSICGWLRMATAFIKLKTTALSKRGDDKVEDAFLKCITETVARVCETDLVEENCCVNG